MVKSNRLKDIVMTGVMLIFLFWVIFGERLCGGEIYYVTNGILLSCIGVAILLSELLIQFIQWELKKAYGRGLKLKDKLRISFEYLKENNMGKTRKAQSAIVILLGFTYACTVEIASVGIFTWLFNYYWLFNWVNIIITTILLVILALYNILNITTYLAVKEMQEEDF